MARLHCLLVLLMALATWTYGFDVDDVADDAADVAVSRTTGVGDDGRGFTFTQVTERNCGQRYSVLKYDDGEIEEIMDDLDDDISIVRLSSTPTKCFIRDITGTQDRCQNGDFPSRGGRPGSESTSYAPGEDVNVEDLPERVQELCQGKTVVRLVAVTDAPATTPADRRAVRDTDLQRNRRQTVMTCTTTKTNCRECSCVGWLFRKRTCQICCDDKETCVTASG